MTHDVRRAGRVLLAGWLAVSALLVAAGWAGAPAAAAADPITIPSCLGPPACVAVEVMDDQGRLGPPTIFDAAQLSGDDADVTDVTYPFPEGGSQKVDRGSSLARLVGLVGIDPTSITFAEVDVANDAFGRYPLAMAEIGPGGFPGNLEPVFYFPSSTVASYIRPQRSDPDDNGPGINQRILNAPGGTLLVVLHQGGQLLDVGVTATPTDDSHRAFTLGSDPTGAAYSYDWRFPGGASSTEQTPTYTVPDNGLAGTYDVTVGVEGADGSFGWGTAPLQIGPPPTQSASPSPTPGSGGSGPASTGPTKHPTHSASGPANPNPSGGSSGGTSGATATPTGPDTSVPTLPTAATDLPSATAPTSEPTVPAAPTPTQPTPSSTPTPSAGSGEQVTGIVLTADEGGPGGPSEVVSDPPPPSQAARPLTDPPFTIGATVWLLTGLVLLMLVGAGSESTGLRGWLARRVWGRWSRMAP